MMGKRIHLEVHLENMWETQWLENHWGILRGDLWESQLETQKEMKWETVSAQ